MWVYDLGKILSDWRYVGYPIVVKREVDMLVGEELTYKLRIAVPLRGGAVDMVATGLAQVIETFQAEKKAIEAYMGSEARYTATEKGVVLTAPSPLNPDVKAIAHIKYFVPRRGGITLVVRRGAVLDYNDTAMTILSNVGNTEKKGNKLIVEVKSYHKVHAVARLMRKIAGSTLKPSQVDRYQWTTIKAALSGRLSNAEVPRNVPEVWVELDNQKVRLADLLEKAGLTREGAEELEKFAWAKMVVNPEINNVTATPLALYKPTLAMKHPDVVTHLEGVAIGENGEITATEEAKTIIVSLLREADVHHKVEMLRRLPPSLREELFYRVHDTFPRKDLTYYTALIAPQSIGFNPKRHKMILLNDGRVLITRGKKTYKLALFEIKGFTPDSPKVFAVYLGEEPYPYYVEAKTLDEAFKKASNASTKIKKYVEQAARIEEEYGLANVESIGGYILYAEFNGRMGRAPLNQRTVAEEYRRLSREAEHREEVNN